MHGKLKVPVGAAIFRGKGRGSVVEFGLATADDAKAPALRIRQSAPWIAGVLAVVVAGSALPQGNIDAGKSPAQLFADTCSNCHRRPQELKRASAWFLRQHYTPGAQEASAMASYLASIPPDPRAGKDRGKAPPEKDKAKAQQQAQERPEERSKAQQLLPKGKRPEVGKSVATEPPTDEPEEATRVGGATVPKLEPFEE
jgi:hypothetical protein